MGTESPEGAFFETYRAHWARVHRLPCTLWLSPLDYGKLGYHVREGLTWQQLDEALEGYFETDNPLVLKRKHPLGLFLVHPMQYAPTPARSTCGHEPPCATRTVCSLRQINDARAAAGRPLL